MSVSLPPDKLADIQQLALSLLKTQPVIVHQVMSFLGKATFCASGHSQLWRLCYVIQSDMLTVYHSSIHLFFSCLLFLFSFVSTGMVISFATEPSTFAISTSRCVIATDAMSTYWAFYFQGSDVLLSVSGSWSGSMFRAHIALQELQDLTMMLHRMAFCLSGKVIVLHL